MSSKDKNISGGESMYYDSHIWLCKCTKCHKDFYSKKTSFICENCLTAQEREKTLEKILNNNNNC
jgi:hypothetical protein